MTAVITLTVFTLVCLVQSCRVQKESKASYLISAAVFLILIGSHVIFNPEI